MISGRATLALVGRGGAARRESAGRAPGPAELAARVCAGAAIGIEIAYPLAASGARTGLTIAAVLLFCAAALAHSLGRCGPRRSITLVVVVGGGGMLAEIVGVASGLPFGSYRYFGELGPQVGGVPWLIGAAWIMMAYPSWTVAGALTRRRPLRVCIAAWALASWDVFLDPQMVHAGLWQWSTPNPSLPGVPGIPLSNYAGWLLVALVLMAMLDALDRPRHGVVVAGAATGIGLPVTVYLWTYASSVLAHATFFALPASAGWGALAMGAVAAPLAWHVLRGHTGNRGTHTCPPRDTRSCG